MKGRLSLSVFTLILIACGSTLKENRRQGYAEIVQTFSDGTAHVSDSSFRFTTRRWYLGQFVIEERIRRNFSDLSASWKDEPVCFLLKDLSKNRGFEFLSLADTASPVSSFSLDDSVELVSGTGYDGRSKYLPPYLSPGRWLSDTVMGNIPFRRFARDMQLENGKRLTDVYFLRCDIDSFFRDFFNSIDSLSSAAGCTVTRMETRDSISAAGFFMIVDVRFIRSMLTSQEKKTFERWIRQTRPD